MFELGNRSN